MNYNTDVHLPNGHSAAGTTDATSATEILACYAIGGILDGCSPNGVTVEQLGKYGECYGEMKRAYGQGGTNAARSVFVTYAERDHEIAALRTSDLQPKSTAYFNARTLLNLMQQPPKEWLMNDLYGPSDLGMIYGPPGSGKTFVVIDMIFSACLAKPFADRFETERPLNVAYCAGEGLSGLPARFRAGAALHDVQSLSNFFYYDNVPQLFDGSAGPTMLDFANDWQRDHSDQPLDLLIIDTLHSAIIGADENSSKDMGKALASVKYAANTLGCAVLLVHHSNKAGTGERGSSALRGAMDFIVEVKPYGDKYSMGCAKLKDGEQWPVQPFDLIPQADSVAVSWGEPAEKAQSRRSEAVGQVKALLSQYPDQRFTAKHIHEAVGGSKTAMDKLLPRMVEKGEIRRELQNPQRAASNRNPWVYSA